MKTQTTVRQYPTINLLNNTILLLLCFILTVGPLAAREHEVVHPLITKKLLTKVLLIALIHDAPTLDAWSTNRNVGLYQRYRDDGRAHRFQYFHEDNPFLRPFAGSPSMYVATNLDVLFTEWLTRKHPKAGQIVFWATQASHLACAAWNIHLHAELVAPRH